jgi:hypothetical protein
VDLLEALADDEMAALAAAVRRGPPVVRPAAPEPPPAEAPEKIAKPVDPTPLFELMRDIVAEGRTGHLHFSHGRQRRSLFFVRGHILYGSVDVEGEHLGHVLVRYGFIDQATLERLVPIVLRERKRLGALLQETGILTAERLDEGIALHVRDILFDMVDRTEGHFSFEDIVLDGAELKAKIVPGQIILEAARRLQAPEVVAKVLGDLDRPLAMSARARIAVQKLTLSPTDGFLLSRIDGILTAREIFQIIPLPQEDVERSLFALLCTGMVEYTPRTAATRARPAESERPATGSVARPGLEGVAPRPAPAVPPPAAPPDPPAARRPTRPAAEAGAGPTEAELQEARDSVGKAEGLLAEGRGREAVDALGPALLHLLGEESIRARLVLARAYMTMPKMLGRADAVLTEAIRDSPKNADLHVAQGRLYALRGDRAKAATAFRRALEIAPAHPDAMAEADAAGPADPTPPGAGRR